MWELLHRRLDGTFVVLRDGLPYQVLPEDPLFPEVAAAADGADLPAEPVIEAPQPPPARFVSKLVVVDRIIAAGKLREVRAMLKFGQPDADLTDAEMALRERWDAARELDREDPQMVAGLASLGLDPDAILAV